MTTTRDYWRGRHVMYRCFNSDMRLLYVGKSSDMPGRLTAHRSTTPWFELVARLRIQVFPTHEAALAAEREAIRTEFPIFNQHGSARPAAVKRPRPAGELRQITEYGRELMRTLMKTHRITIRDLAELCGGGHFKSSIGHLTAGHRVTCNAQLAEKIEAALLGPDSEDRIFLPERHLWAVS